MRILILGGDGYLGWPTAMHFSARGHEVTVVDNFARRRWHLERGTDSLTPIASLADRLEAWQEVSGRRDHAPTSATSRIAEFLDRIVARMLPETVDPLRRALLGALLDDLAPPRGGDADAITSSARSTCCSPCASTCPTCHLVKLGTMGEYGTPNIDIEEGYIEIEHNGRRDRLPFPKLPGSLYHLSKVHDSHNIHFACRVWGLRATDLNQGVVYGIQTDRDGRSTSAWPRASTTTSCSAPR